MARILKIKEKNMFKVVKSVYYREKRNSDGIKIDDESNGVVKDIEGDFSPMESIVEVSADILESHGIAATDLLLNKVSAEVVGSSLVVKLYEIEDGSRAATDDLAVWKDGGELFLGCYKYDIQKVVMQDINFDEIAVV
jgi:hypothetical protein